jgi:hypothetical protein
MSVRGRFSFMPLAAKPLQGLALIVGLAAVASTASLAQDREVQILDTGVSGDFEVSASFTIALRGDVPAAAKAEEGHLYLGDEAILKVSYKGAKLFGDWAKVRCALNGFRPDGDIDVIDCTSRIVTLDALGTEGEYSVGFSTVPTDPGGLWPTEITLTDKGSGATVTVEIRFWVHTEAEI